MNKKGMELTLTKLGMIMFGIVSLIVVLLVMSPLYSSFEEKGSENACRAQVVAKTGLKFNIAGEEIALGTLDACQTTDHEVRGSKEKIMSQLSSMSARCWWMMNEARQDDLFEDPKILNKLLGFDRNKNGCFMCYTAHIKQKNIVGGNIEAEDMFNYFQDTNYPKIKGLSYLDYIQEYGGPGAFGVLDQIEADNIYGVVYLSKSKDESGAGWADYIAGGAVGLGIACTVVTGGVCGVLIGGAGSFYLGFHGADLLNNIFNPEERDVSSIMIGKLDTIRQGGCDVKDFS